MILIGDVDRAGIVLGGDDALHVGVLRHAGRLVHLAPVFAAVLGDLHQAIVGADVNQALLFGRFGDRRDVVIERRGNVLLNGLDGPDFAHQRQLVAIQLAGEIRADGDPGIAAVVAAIELLRADVEARMGVRADDERRVPIPAEGRIALGGLRLDGDALAGALVEAHDAGVLAGGVNGVGILRIDARVEPVAARW